MKKNITLNEAFEAITNAGFVITMTLTMDGDLNPKTGKVAFPKATYTVPVNKPFAVKKKR